MPTPRVAQPLHDAEQPPHVGLGERRGRLVHDQDAGVLATAPWRSRRAGGWRPRACRPSRRRRGRGCRASRAARARARAHRAPSRARRSAVRGAWPRKMFSATVSSGNSSSSWWTVAMPAACASRGLSEARPARRRCGSCRSSGWHARRTMILISVDLPAPFSPSSAWTSPGAHVEVDILEHADAARRTSTPPEAAQGPFHCRSRQRSAGLATMPLPLPRGLRRAAFISTSTVPVTRAILLRGFEFSLSRVEDGDVSTGSARRRLAQTRVTGSAARMRSTRCLPEFSTCRWINAAAPSASCARISAIRARCSCTTETRRLSETGKPRAIGAEDAAVLPPESRRHGDCSDGRTSAGGSAGRASSGRPGRRSSGPRSPPGWPPGAASSAFRHDADEPAREVGLDQHLDLEDVAHEVLVDRPHTRPAVGLMTTNPSPRSCCRASRTGFVDVPSRTARSATFSRSLAARRPSIMSSRIRS